MTPIEMKPEWEWVTQTIFKPEVFWVMITAIATLALVIFAALPLRSLAKTRRTDLARRLRDDFWTPRARVMMFLVDHNLLQYVPGDPPYFSIAQISGDPAQARVQEAFGDRALISIFEIDDELLNPLEEVAALAFAKSVDLEDVYALFGNFIGSTVENEQIRRHIEDVRRTPNAANAWIHLERIVPLFDHLDEEFRELSVTR